MLLNISVSVITIDMDGSGQKATKENHCQCKARGG